MWPLHGCRDADVSTFSLIYVATSRHPTLSCQRFLSHKGEGLMLDLTFIRSNPDVVKEAARVKNNPIDIDALLAVDQQVLALQREIEEMRAGQNKLNKEIQNAAKEKNTELRNALIAEGKGLAERLKEKEPQ